MLSYADLDRLSDEVAVGMSRRGIGPGDVVALSLGSGPGYVVAYAAAAKIGAITAGVNEKLSRTREARLLALARPALVIAASAVAGRRSADVGIAVAAALDVAASIGAVWPVRRPAPRASGRRRAARRHSRRPGQAGRDRLHVGHDRVCRKEPSSASGSSTRSRESGRWPTLRAGGSGARFHLDGASRNDDEASTVDCVGVAPLS